MLLARGKETTLRLGLVLLALTIVAAATLILGRRRRRRGAPALAGMPPGLTHLVSHVGALSSFDMGLTLPPHGGRRRPGTLIGVR